jgi:hypothetical protein
MRVKSLRAGAILFPLLVIGCGKSQNATVSGIVTYDGQPLSTGAVTFQPVAPGPLAIGDIRNDGAYTLRTGDATGLSAGEYQVTVVATGPMPEATPSNPMPLPELLIPARYGDVSTSGLKYTVERGENRIDIALENE